MGLSERTVSWYNLRTTSTFFRHSNCHQASIGSVDQWGVFVPVYLKELQYIYAAC